MPFTTENEAGFPVPVLAQVNPDEFEICVPFKYRRDESESWLTVPKSDAYRRTDLASVPAFLLWLVPRYGAHTLAALVHDQMVKDPPDGGRIEADTRFRDALGELQVPWIRRWMMWAAVSVGTMLASLLGKVRVVLWGLFVLIASATFWQHAFAAVTELRPWSPWFVFARGPEWDLLIIGVAAIVFVPRIGLGLLAGASVVFVFVPTTAVLLTVGAYLALEALAREGLKLYNRILVPRMNARRVDEARAIMMMSPELPPEKRGCPQLPIGS